jgi:hypothetical protein
VSFANVLLVSGSANFSTRDVWDGYRVALAAEGLRVVPYPTFSFLKVLSVDAVCNDILGTALDVANLIDGVVFVDGLYFRGERARVPLSLRRAGVTTVLIATDDPYETIPSIEDLYTYRFTNEIRSAVRGAEYLPTATLPLPDVPRTLHPRYDVSFVGTVFEDRLPVLVNVAELCERERKRFLIAGKLIGNAEAFERFAGTELRQRTIDTVEKWEIYAQSRLVLNVFRQTEQPADSPSPRVFEVAAFGQAALVTGPRRSEVKRIFGDAVYHFDDAESVADALQSAWSDEALRVQKVDRAREIALGAHLYEHRARALIAHIRDAEHHAAISGPAEERIAWIIGCGRTGSTWLAEMLGDLPKIRRWHEPYFGRFLKHVDEHPDDLDRRASFFYRRHQQVWIDGLRDLFFRMVAERFPQSGRQSLFVKEVNTPELYPWLRALFPTGKLVLLVRDPYDVLDSYLDLQKPGSWNQSFELSNEADHLMRVRRTAEHIRATMLLAQKTFDEFPLEQRLQLSYEEQLRDPVPGLIACGQLVAADVDPQLARQVAERHAFENYEQTGALQFRRRGQAGGWTTSENFAADVRAIADEVLGPLRGRLGYGEG